MTIRKSFHPPSRLLFIRPKMARRAFCSRASAYRISLQHGAKYQRYGHHRQGCGLAHQGCAKAKGNDAKDGRQRLFKALGKDIGKNHADNATHKSPTLSTRARSYVYSAAGIEPALLGGQAVLICGPERCGDAKIFCPGTNRSALARGRQHAENLDKQAVLVCSLGTTRHFG